MKRPIQYFSKEYLENCKNIPPEQIIEYLENFRLLIGITQQQDKEDQENKPQK